MTIYQTPSHTTVGRGFVTSKLLPAITEAHVRSGFLKTNQSLDQFNPSELDGIACSIITNGTSQESELPYFAHPIVVSMKALAHRGEPDYMVADMRMFLSAGEGLNIRNASEYSFNKLRLVLSRAWYKGEVAAIKTTNNVAAGIYSSWISENITRRLGLDPLDQHKIAIVAAIYYYSLFTNEPFSEGDKQKICAVIARVTRADAQQVFEIMDSLDEIHTMDDFIAQIRKALDNNPRLEPLNVGLLVTLLNTSWFGTGAREIVSVAIDHPPTWVALLFAAFTERTYKASPLARLAERYRGNKGEAEFVRSVRYLHEKFTT